MNQAYLECIERGVSWINREMLTFDGGYYGIYERIRINDHIRTNWSRPDCNAEYLRVLLTRKALTGDAANDGLIEKITSWFVRTQDGDEFSVWKGSLPFYVVDGHIRGDKVGETIYQNDNGKVMVIMCQLYARFGDERHLRIAEGVAQYWLQAQRPDGTFGRIDGRNVHVCAKGPCFVLWLVSGYFLLYGVTGEKKYLCAAEKGMKYILTQTLHESGRSLTSYEIMKMEDWRPVSSETSMALYALATAYSVTGDKSLLPHLHKLAAYVLKLQHPCGAIMNCDESCMDASLQNNPDLCDLVYTQGFALQALVLAAKAAGRAEYSEAAERLASFLAGIQCRGESDLWDGGWRGSYNVRTRQWDGRANQNNTIDEGGMYSVYTGWCCTNIMYGMQQLLEKQAAEEGGAMA